MANKEKKAAYAKIYNEKNKEKIKAQHAAYYAANIETRSGSKNISLFPLKDIGEPSMMPLRRAKLSL